MAETNGKSAKLLAIIMAIGLAVTLTYTIVSHSAGVEAKACATKTKDDLADFKGDQKGLHATTDSDIRQTRDDIGEIKRMLERHMEIRP